MKGIVFTEFLDMVENEFSYEVADKIIEENSLASNGAYTSVGNYDNAEMIMLITSLSKHVNTPAEQLATHFGKYLLNRFFILFPHFFTSVSTTFDFLDTIDRHVHVEVKKLYSDAELPSFETKRISERKMQMFYRSGNPFACLAGGLIEGACEKFNEKITIKKDISADHMSATFTLTKED
ncbi:MULTISPECIES: heme NO-binding domain-containing protein [Pseudoalteromonas]|uniref:heme NO-binding domain-containing protein n=1 Tax=Pseudoalteromonas sp. T1lg21 TaxID=2077095 RepID=UPI000CF6BACA|nr:heme NO-binding domain-containing protein [Pseudoalteromonas sp. T1lg21]